MNKILALAISFICFILLKEFVSPVFTLIDDNIIEEILSGKFTGSPDGHIVYIKYTLAYLLSRLYYINSNIPWYGLFLIGCEAASIFFVVFRICSHNIKIYKKVLFSLSFLVVFFSLALNGLVFFTYTSVAGLLGSTAIFWFLTIDENSQKRTLILNYIVFIILYLTAFSIRSNIIIMLSPVLILAVVFKFKRSLLKKFLFLGLALVISLAAILVVEKSAYSSEEWKYYMEFNNARTAVYETKGIINYQENIETFNELGISKELHQLYIGYYFNFGINTDDNALTKLTEIVKQPETNLLNKLFDILFGDTYKITTYVFLFLYFLPLVFFIVKKKYKEVIFLLALLLFISLPMFYMIFVKKFVFRVGISCFYAGLMFITALLIQSKIKKSVWVLIGVGILFGLTAQILETKKDFNSGHYFLSSLEREAIKDWCEANPENIYFITNNMYVDFGTLINPKSSGLINCTSLGMGWIARSPLVDEKLLEFGIENIETGLIENDNAYIITYQGNKIETLINYYQSEFPNVKAELYETFTTSNGGKYDVWKLN